MIKPMTLQAAERLGLVEEFTLAEQSAKLMLENERIQHESFVIRAANVQLRRMAAKIVGGYMKTVPNSNEIMARYSIYQWQEIKNLSEETDEENARFLLSRIEAANERAAKYGAENEELKESLDRAAIVIMDDLGTHIALRQQIRFLENSWWERLKRALKL